MKPIDRLKKEYSELAEKKKKYNLSGMHTTEQIYKAMRLFALDCNLVSFNEIESIEFEIDEQFKTK